MIWLKRHIVKIPFVAICVAERPQQRFAFPETEFEQATTELATERRSTDTDALLLKNLA
jgi:hypothetical protein